MKYEYICPNCKHEYVEQRPETDAPYFTNCNACLKAEYVGKNES